MEITKDTEMNSAWQLFFIVWIPAYAGMTKEKSSHSQRERGHNHEDVTLLVAICGANTLLVYHKYKS